MLYINHYLQTHLYKICFIKRGRADSSTNNCRRCSCMGTQMYSDSAWWSECIPKFSSLISSHLSLFSLANTMPLVPRRIIGQHCRRQTIYWHFASLNSTVSLPGTIHFKQYVFWSPSRTFLGHNNLQYS